MLGENKANTSYSSKCSACQNAVNLAQFLLILEHYVIVNLTDCSAMYNDKILYTFYKWIAGIISRQASTSGI